VEGNNVQISVEGVGAELVPVEPDKNTAGVVAKTLLDLSKKECGLTMKIKKGIRPGSGLGSSAASAAAAALAINEALNLNLSRRELIKFAAQGETASAGVPHADNVSSALLGFFTVVKSYDPLEVIRLPSPKNVEFAIATPDIVINTSLARSVLPKRVKLSDLARNIGHAAAFIAGIALNDVDLMGESMTDSIIEPARAHLIPGLAEVKKSAIEAGAAGVTISGAGSSILALVNAEKKKTDDVAKAMRNAFEKQGINCETIRAKPGPGARIVRRKQ